MIWQWTDETRGRLQAFVTQRNIMGIITDIKPIGDGHSNLTFLIGGGEREFVLRRPPPPPLPPGSNDVLREAKVMAALAGSDAPVPKIYAAGQAGEVFDVPFYVMEYIPGAIIIDQLPPSYDRPDAMAKMGCAFINGLASLHNVDWRGCGLEKFGKPDGFNARHLSRISSLVRDDAGRILSEFADIYKWLENNCPAESDAAIIHNDYRIGNLMWSDKAPPQLLAILDWELATIGDPLLDLAYLISSVPSPDATHTPVQDLASAVMGKGFSTHAELIAQYAAKRDMQTPNLNWYLTMVNWKLAALYHYSRARGSDAYYQDVAHVPRFLSFANSHISN